MSFSLLVCAIQWVSDQSRKSLAPRYRFAAVNIASHRCFAIELLHCAVLVALFSAWKLYYETLASKLLLCLLLRGFPFANRCFCAVPCLPLKWVSSPNIREGVLATISFASLLFVRISTVHLASICLLFVQTCRLSLIGARCFRNRPGIYCPGVGTVRSLILAVRQGRF